VNRRWSAGSDGGTRVFEQGGAPGGLVLVEADGKMVCYRLVDARVRRLLGEMSQRESAPA